MSGKRGVGSRQGSREPMQEIKRPSDSTVTPTQLYTEALTSNRVI